jgi:hypothetical protein
LPHEEKKKSLELFIKHVVPAFRKTLCWLGPVNENAPIAFGAF